MEQYEEVLDRVLSILVEGKLSKNQQAPVTEIAKTIPVGISNRHAHLSRADIDSLFGKGYELTKLKDLSQPGQYACKECVTICGPKGVLEKIRVLGPARPVSQIEILQGDTFKLGIKGELRLSGDLNGTPGATVIGPKGSVQLTQGVIVAHRHIHMLPEEAKHFGVVDGEQVSIEFDGPRGGVLNNVIIRATANSGLECHIDTEEANALGVTSSTRIDILK